MEGNDRPHASRFTSRTEGLRPSRPGGFSYESCSQLGGQPSRRLRAEVAVLDNNLFLAEWSDEGAIDRLGKTDSRGLGSPIPNWMNFPIRIPSGSCSASQEAIMVKVSVMQSKRRAPRNGSPVEPASRVDVMPPTQPHNGSHGLGADLWRARAGRARLL